QSRGSAGSVPEARPPSRIASPTLKDGAYGDAPEPGRCRHKQSALVWQRRSSPAPFEPVRWWARALMVVLSLPLPGLRNPCPSDQLEAGLPENAAALLNPISPDGEFMKLNNDEPILFEQIDG